jgi:hypothetical protein cdiviTM7_01485
MKKLVVQIFLFGIVGITTLLVDTLVTSILYYIAHLPAFMASGIGFLSGFCVNFPLNRKQVFNHSEDDRFPLKAQIYLYASLSIFNLIATSVTVDVLVSTNILEIQWAKIVTTVVFAVWNFLVFKLFIFSKKVSHEERQDV